MPIFKDTVALEACPAKTAESVSYVATFSVLGWLVLSNYAVLGASEDAHEQSIASLPLSSGSNAANTIATLDLNTEQNPIISQDYPLREAPLPEFVSWHVSLDMSSTEQGRSRLKAVPGSEWQQRSSMAMPEDMAPTQMYLSDLALPSIDLNLLSPGLELADLASNEANPAAIHEITVTSTEPERLNVRPDNIIRPQLPRPIRANEIQRSIILPPRIQALRP